MIKLNLGCGHDYIKGYDNIDSDNKQFKVDLCLDLETAKLPYKDNSVTLVRACHILEHLHNFIPLMKEIYRVLIPEGVIYIRVPEFPCGAAIADPTHVRFFIPQSWYLWTPQRAQGEADTGNIGGLFELSWIESIARDSGLADRGKHGGWFTEIEVELTKIDRAKNDRQNKRQKVK